jgi:hypothetical protein
MERWAFLTFYVVLKGCLGELFGYELFWNETVLNGLILFKVCGPFGNTNGPRWAHPINVI